MRRFALLFLVAATCPVYAADVPGSHDPQYLKRFQGSEILSFVNKSFEHYAFAMGPGVPNAGFTQTDEMEGQLTRVIYRIPQGHTPLELLRNYEHMLTDTGLKQTFEIGCSPQNAQAEDFVARVLFQSFPRGNEDVYQYPASTCYLYAKGVKDGKTTGVAVMIVEKSSDTDFTGIGAPKKITVKKGDVLVGVDELVQKPVGNSMSK